MFSKEEKYRYSRQIILPEIGIEGQKKLKQAKILVVGAGGLGCPVLQYLSAAGVGTIGVADGDVVDETNLHRQILFNMEDAGINKADVVRKKLLLLNPNLKIASYTERLTSENILNIIKEYDLVVDGSDNFPTRYLVNDACVILNRPFVFGSILKFEGQISVFNYKNGPTYRCLFPESPVDSPNCAEIGVLGVLPGIIGSMMANEALKIILGIGKILSGKLFVFDVKDFQTKIISFMKNPENGKINSLIDYDMFCNTKKNSVKEISVHEFKKLIDNKKDFQLIDVREKFEYVLSNINGENIPLSSIEGNIVKISFSKQVILHCKSGVRSAKAVELLQQKFGFANLYNLEGGLDAWNEAERRQSVIQ